MNRIHLHRQREPWMTGMAAVLGLAVIAALVAWLWRPSKLVQAVPAPLEASAPVASVPDDAQAAPAQARRALALAGRWSRLSAGDQAILAPLKDDWAELSADQRLKWLELSLRFPSMAVDEQQRVQDRMAQWARMTPAERGAARLNFQEIRLLCQRAARTVGGLSGPGPARTQRPRHQGASRGAESGGAQTQRKLRTGAQVQRGHGRCANRRRRAPGQRHPGASTDRRHHPLGHRTALKPACREQRSTPGGATRHGRPHDPAASSPKQPTIALGRGGRHRFWR